VIQFKKAIYSPSSAAHYLSFVTEKVTFISVTKTRHSGGFFRIQTVSLTCLVKQLLFFTLHHSLLSQAQFYWKNKRPMCWNWLMKSGWAQRASNSASPRRQYTTGAGQSDWTEVRSVAYSRVKHRNRQSHGWLTSYRNCTKQTIFSGKRWVLWRVDNRYSSATSVCMDRSQSSG